MSDQDQKWCFAWAEEASDRAAAPKATLWKPGDKITIAFLDGDKGLQDRVKEASRQWIGPKMANLEFAYQRSRDSLIRISFKQRGSWSVVGTTCRNITDEDRPTMNFGWLTPGSSDADLNRVVLHEFGHALGLVHEHQNPAGGIPWNRPQVEADLAGPPNFWDKAKVELNMFQAYAKRETNFTKFDPESIMLYPIPAKWTTNGFSTELNAELSATDIAFIRKAYPW